MDCVSIVSPTSDGGMEASTTVSVLRRTAVGFSSSVSHHLKLAKFQAPRRRRRRVDVDVGSADLDFGRPRHSRDSLPDAKVGLRSNQLEHCAQSQIRRVRSSMMMTMMMKMASRMAWTKDPLETGDDSARRFPFGIRVASHGSGGVHARPRPALRPLPLTFHATGGRHGAARA